MEDINKAPIRTSRNFKINDVKIENIAIPEKIEEFKNTKVIASENLIIENKTQIKKLVYGNGDFLEEYNNKNLNNEIKITSKSKEKSKTENIKIVYNFSDNDINLINKIQIVAGENANLNVVIEYQSNTKKECFHNGIVNVIAKDNSNINIIIVNMLNQISNHFESIENELYNNSNLNYTIIDLGGKYSIQNYYSNIIGESSNNDLKSIYLGKEKQLKDTNYIAELRGKKSNIDIDVQGALKDESVKHFKGTIDFKKGSKKSKGNENEYCVLLSDKAKSIALPMLLCTEDDVEGNHSTASGKLDKKELFYIMSRGFSHKEAIKLIVKAKFNKIIERIQDDETKNKVLEEIDRRLD